MKKFLVLWAGELLSTIGSGLTAFGLGVYVYQQTHMASSTALIALLGLLPMILLGPVAGVLADRYDRRLLMILGDSLSAIGLFYILFCLMSGHAKLWQICTGVTISSVFASLLEPAYRATITDMLPKEQYSKASGLMQMAGSAKFLISPFLAGFIMKFSGITMILWIDIATFFITVFATLFVARGMRKKQAENQESFGAQFKEGVAILLKKRGVMLLVILSAVVCFFLTFIQVLSTPMVIAFSDEATLGVCETICAMGMLVSSLFLGAVAIKKNYVKILSFSFFFLGLFMMLFGLRENVILITVAGFLFFAALPFANTCLDLLVRSNIPNELQGRAWGMIGLISQMGYVIANVMIGYLVDYFFDPALCEGGIFYNNLGRVIGTGAGRGSAFLILLGGLCLCFFAPVIYRTKSIRQLEREGESA
ncbi:MAG: MFS transporter [Eubacterium sp.]|nr:MFS transporter [Eubacterium sp.]